MISDRHSDVDSARKFGMIHRQDLADASKNHQLGLRRHVVTWSYKDIFVDATRVIFEVAALPEQSQR